MVSKLSEHGVAGFVLANGSMSTNTTGEGAIRQKMIENDLVDCMIALPGQLFFTTQIPVCIWILSKDKKGDAQSPSPQTPLPKGEGLRNSKKASLPLGETGVREQRDRRGETLFIDARKIGSMISRTQKELTAEDISKIAETYHAWKSELPSPLGGRAGDEGAAYEDVPGYCKSAPTDDIKKHDYVLTPGRYVGAAALEDDGIPFETKMTEMSQTLFGQMEESAKLDEVIRKNLEGLGYGK
jgi:type I restriction enzyme M protein